MSSKKIVLKKKPIKPQTQSASDVDLDEICMFPMIDLRSRSSLVKKINQNTLITDKLRELIEVTKAKKASATDKSEKTKHAFRIRSFMKALTIISDYDKPISSKKEALNLDGVGKGIGTRIEEILNTGTLKEIECAISPQTKAIIDLCKITGIGEARATMLVQLGVTGVEDLIKKYDNHEITVTKNQLTKHIVVGLKYYYDIIERFTWEEADYMATYIKSFVSQKFSDLKVEICGSYRRHKNTCGDIDVLICHPDLKTKADIETCKTNYLSDIVKMMTSDGFIVDHLTDKGNTKFMGVAIPLNGSTGRRIDIRFIEYDALGAAMLYFTGSGTFNKIMRYVANERGFTLNEYGLYYYHNGVKCGLIKTTSEKDIFKALKIKYVEPTERDLA